MEFCIQEKIDGISIRLTYVNGSLQEMVTRGDGLVGDDITAHAKFMSSIPKSIDCPHIIHVRGEAVMYEGDFNLYYAPLKREDGTPRYMNARNTVSGMLKGRTAEEHLSRIHFVAYELFAEALQDRTEYGSVNYLRVLGFETPCIVALVHSAEAAKRLYLEYDQQGRRESLPYKTDGLVIKVNDRDLQSRFPSISGRPGHAVAVKPTSKSSVTTVTGVTWNMGLSGAFTPVANVEPVELDGTICRNVNMFNLDFLDIWVNGGYLEAQKKQVKGGFGIGARVLITRAGDVLPYLIDVLSPAPVVNSTVSLN
jgi:DNA ligase (NAD+)